MGQVQSDAIDNQSQTDLSNSSKPNSSNDSPPPSLDSLIAEAAAYGEDGENESIDEKARKALECPCIAHLRAGPCGKQFSDAFLCFLKSTAEEKGSDCVSPFVALQSCIKANPNAFSKDVLEEDDDDMRKQDEVKTEETPKQEYRIIPPIWSVESKKTKRTKLKAYRCLSCLGPSILGSSGSIILITTTLTSKSIARKILSLYFSMEL